MLKYISALMFLFLLTIRMPSYGDTVFPLSADHLMDIWVVSTLGAIVNNGAAVNVHIQVFERTSVFISHG